MKFRTPIELISDVYLMPSHLKKTTLAKFIIVKLLTPDVIYININILKNTDLLIDVLCHELEHANIIRAIFFIATREEQHDFFRNFNVELVHSNPSIETPVDTLFNIPNR